MSDLDDTIPGRAVPATDDAKVPATEAATPAAPAAQPGSGSGTLDKARLEQLVVDALHSVYDPEIPVDIYDLGLIYSVDIDDDARVSITMTLTTPACPVAGSLPGEVENVVRLLDDVTDVVVDLVWEPQWTPAMMTEAARLQLNMY